MIPAVLTLWHREVVRFFRQPNRVIGALLSPVVFWLIVGSGFGQRDYMFPGILVMIILFAAIFSTISIIEDRREGFLQGVFVSPAPRLAIAVGKVLGGTTVAVLQAGPFLLVAPLLGITPTLPALALPALAVLVLLGLGLTGLGFLIAWRMDSVQGFHAIMNLLLLPMWVLSGALFPVAGAERWLQWIMRANPLTYGLSLLRHAMTEDTAGLPSLWLSLVVTIVFAVVTVGLAGWAAGYRPRGGAA